MCPSCDFQRDARHPDVFAYAESYFPCFETALDTTESSIAMRRPIQRQLLVPMLVVVLACVAVASVAAAWTGAQSAREQEREHLRRLASTLADAGFPLTENVLRQMAGLSGAEFIVLGDDQRVVRSTVALTDTEASVVTRLDERSTPFRQGTDDTVALATGKYLSVRLPVRATSTPGMSQSLCVLVPEEQWNRVARRAAWPPIFAGLIAAGVAVALTSLLARRFTQPIRQLSEQATAIADGQFHSTPLPVTDDELRDLAVSLNSMSEQLSHYEEQVRRSERMRTLGQLGAGIAHQMRNSATGARMALEFHAAEIPASTDRESLNVALRQLELMEASLKRFLRLGREETLTMEDVSLSRLVTETLPLVEPMARHANIELTARNSHDDIVICGEADSLRQMLLNLLVNAIEAATDASGQRMRVHVEWNRLDRDRVELRILDSGSGPSPAIATALFEPFVTTKPDGTGLGLAVAQQIAKAHHANLSWKRENNLTCFSVVFPDNPQNENSAPYG